MASLTEFCGTSNSSVKFVIWDSSTGQLGSCFQWLCLTGISHLILAVVSAFLLGSLSIKTYRIEARSKCGIFRLLLCYFNAVIAIISVILAYTLRHYHPPAFVLSKTVTFSAWLICALLCHRLLATTKLVNNMLKILAVPVVIVLASSSAQLYDYVKFVSSSQGSVQRSKWHVPVCFAMNVFFTLTVFIGISLSRKGNYMVGRKSQSLARTGIQVLSDEETSRYPEEDALLGTHIDSYNSFGEPSFVGDSVLGWADEEANIFSKVFFHWVNPLMKKGNRYLLRKADDLFLPPMSLDTKMIKEIFQSILRLQKLSSHFSFGEMSRGETSTQRKATLEAVDEGERKPLKISLSKALYKAFGIVFMIVGVLKFLADCVSFAGPVLLDRLVSFMENKKVCITEDTFIFK